MFGCYTYRVHLKNFPWGILHVDSFPVKIIYTEKMQSEYMYMSKHYFLKDTYRWWIGRTDSKHMFS